MEAFLTYLDEKVGKGTYMLFLTADHAAAHNVRFLQDHEIPAGAWAFDKTKAALNALIKAQFGVEEAVPSLENYQVYLNRTRLEAAGADYEKVKACAIRFLETQEEREKAEAAIARLRTEMEQAVLQATETAVNIDYLVCLEDLNG